MGLVGLLIIFRSVRTFVFERVVERSSSACKFGDYLSLMGLFVLCFLCTTYISVCSQFSLSKFLQRVPKLGGFLLSRFSVHAYVR